MVTGAALVYYPFGNDVLHALPTSLLTYLAMVLFPNKSGTWAWLINFPYLIALCVRHGGRRGLRWCSGCSRGLHFAGAAGQHSLPRQPLCQACLVASAACCALDAPCSCWERQPSGGPFRAWRGRLTSSCAWLGARGVQARIKRQRSGLEPGADGLHGRPDGAHAEVDRRGHVPARPQQQEAGGARQGGSLAWGWRERRLAHSMPVAPSAAVRMTN